jgi:hypothetical protein
MNSPIFRLEFVQQNSEVRGAVKLALCTLVFLDLDKKTLIFDWRFKSCNFFLFLQF